MPDLKQQIIETLQQNMPRADLLQAMSDLAESPDFRSQAAVWAPALLVRDVAFFEGFILRHLPRWGYEDLIEAMLPYIEAVGRNRMFSQLYMRVRRGDRWDKDLLELAQSDLSDEEVLAAVKRRSERSWNRITEQTALALYRRSPEQFGSLLKQHIRPNWWGHDDSYEDLSKLVQENGDDDLYWHIFRQTATEKQWVNEIRQVLKDRPDDIVGALKKRHPAFYWNHNPSVLLDVLDEYGESALPYIKDNLRWITQRRRDSLLKRIRRLDKPSLYWPMFFKVAGSHEWNNELRSLLKRDLPDIEFMLELQRRTPESGGRWSRWQLEGDVAIALYQRNPTLARPFIEMFLFRVDINLFDYLTEVGDEKLLDFVTFRMMHEVNSLGWYIFNTSPYWQRRQADLDKQREQWDILVSRATDRFDRLYAKSPETYVRHVANTLSYLRAFEVWSFRRTMERNPIFAYMINEHHEAWLQSSNGIRELLESPNIFVMLTGLYILSGGGPDAADRAAENLMMLQAFLLGRTKTNTKKKVLAALENAGYHGYADDVLPILEQAVDFKGKRAIDELVLAAYVRLLHHAGLMPVPAYSCDVESYHAG